MPQIKAKLTKPTVFGFGIVVGEPDDGRTTATVLFTAIGNLYRTAPRDTAVLFTPMGDTVIHLAQRLLEGCNSEILYERRLYRPLLAMWGNYAQPIKTPLSAQ